MTQHQPTADDAIAIVEQHLGIEALTAARFPAGLAHFVYDVTLVDGRRVVARLARPGQGSAFAGAIHWHGLLRPRGVPLPALYAYDSSPPDAFPFMLMERLPGRDLQDVYPTLSQEQKQRLAGRVAGIQRIVASLPQGRGYGFGASADDPALLPTWRDVLLASLERSRARIAKAGIVSTEHVDRAAERLPAFDRYFARVAPTPFLDDMTTKNVLVHEGELSGIVDVDWVCFGDPLFTLALTRMALLARRYATDYVDYWAAELDLSAEQQAALSFYTALFCVDFLSELGHQFNQVQNVSVDLDSVEHLLTILADLVFRI